MTDLKLIRYKTQYGLRTAILICSGPKFHTLIMMDAAGLTLTRVPKAEARWFREMQYPIKRAVKKFRAAGRRFGMTKGARQVLR